LYIFEYFGKEFTVKRFTEFCICFEIAPHLIQVGEEIDIFNQKNKEQLNLQGDEKQCIDYKEFEEILVKIALLCKNRIAIDGKLCKGGINTEYVFDIDIIEKFFRYLKIKHTDTYLILDERLKAPLNLSDTRNIKVDCNELKDATIVENVIHGEKLRWKRQEDCFNISKDNKEGGLLGNDSKAEKLPPLNNKITPTTKEYNLDKELSKTTGGNNNSKVKEEKSCVLRNSFTKLNLIEETIDI